MQTSEFKPLTIEPEEIILYDVKQGQARTAYATIKCNMGASVNLLFRTSSSDRIHISTKQKTLGPHDSLTLEIKVVINKPFPKRPNKAPSYKEVVYIKSELFDAKIPVNIYSQPNNTLLNSQKENILAKQKSVELQEELRKSLEKGKELEQYITFQKKSTNEKDELMNQLSNCKARVRDLEEQLQKEPAYIRAIKDTLGDKNPALEKLVDLSLKQEQEKYEMQSEKVLNILSVKDQLISELQDNLNEKDESIHDLRTQLQIYEDEEAKYKEAIGQMESTKAKMAEAEETIKILTKENNELKESAEKLMSNEIGYKKREEESRRYKFAEELVKRYDSDNKKLKSDIEATDKKLAECLTKCEYAQKENIKYKEILDHLCEQCGILDPQELSKVLKSLDDSNTILQTKISELEDMNYNTNEKNINLNTQIDNLSKDKKELQGEISKMNASVSHLTNLNTDLDNLNKEQLNIIQTLKKDREKPSTSSSDTQTQEQVDERITTMQSCIEQLEQEKAKLTEDIGTLLLSKNEEQTLDAIYMQEENSKLKAIISSLKANEIQVKQANDLHPSNDKCQKHKDKIKYLKSLLASAKVNYDMLASTIELGPPTTERKKEWIDKQKEVMEMQIAQKTKENVALIESMAAMEVKLKETTEEVIKIKQDLDTTLKHYQIMQNEHKELKSKASISSAACVQFEKSIQAAYNLVNNGEKYSKLGYDESTIAKHTQSIGKPGIDIEIIKLLLDSKIMEAECVYRLSNSEKEKATCQKQNIDLKKQIREYERLCRHYERMNPNTKQPSNKADAKLLATISELESKLLELSKSKQVHMAKKSNSPVGCEVNDVQSILNSITYLAVILAAIEANFRGHSISLPTEVYGERLSNSLDIEYSQRIVIRALYNALTQKNMHEPVYSPKNEGDKKLWYLELVESQFELVDKAMKDIKKWSDGLNMEVSGSVSSVAQIKSASLDMASSIRHLTEELNAFKETISLIKHDVVEVVQA